MREDSTWSHGEDQESENGYLPESGFPTDREPLSETDWMVLLDYMTNTATPQERAATEQRLQSDADFARRATPFLTIWNTPQILPQKDLDAAWASIQRKVALRRAAATVPPPTVVPSRGDVTSTTRTPSAAAHGATQGVGRSWWRHGAPTWATVFLFVLMVGFATTRIIQQPREIASQVYTALGTSRTMTLADGSQVILAPGATLFTDNVRGQRVRSVHLLGTGTFAVRADPTHPFIVNAAGIAAVALGTHFEVAVRQRTLSQRAADVHVTVQTGKVLVQRTVDHISHTLTILGPGGDTTVSGALEDFKRGYAAAAAHVSIAQLYLEEQSREATRQQLRDAGTSK